MTPDQDLWSDAGIFYPTENSSLFQWHFSNLCSTGLDNLRFYQDEQTWLSDHHAIKIACVEITSFIDDRFTDFVDRIAPQCDRILMLVPELHSYTVKFMRSHDTDKIIYFVCGFVNAPLQQSVVHQYLSWFTSTVHFYKNVRPDVLQTLNPYECKPFFVDALLGRAKPHRQMAFDFIVDHIPDKALVTYMQQPDLPLAKRPRNEWIWEMSGLVYDDQQIWTADMVTYHGHQMSLCQVLPLDIYRQCAYSLVAETYANNDYIFITEKTVKPIIAKRLFVMIGPYRILRKLKELGFQTFDSIIDESYDEVSDNEQRIMMALRQLEKLCAKSQEEVLAQVRPIVEHNFQHLMTTDWYRSYFLRNFEKSMLNAITV